MKERFPKSQYTFGQDKKGTYRLLLYCNLYSHLALSKILNMIITHNFKD